MVPVEMDFARREQLHTSSRQETENDMGSAGRIALRVAVTFGCAAVAWALVFHRLETHPVFRAENYDYILDLGFAIVTASLLYVVVSRELLARAVAQQAAVAEVWHAARKNLETRVAERTDELERANAQLQAEIGERTRAEQELTRLLDLSCQVASTLDLRQLLTLILEHVERTIGYTSASIWRYDGETRVAIAYQGKIPSNLVLEDATATSELPGEKMVVDEQCPVIIPDLLDESEQARAYRELASQRLLGANPFSRSWMGVPLVIEGRTTGMMRLDHDIPDYFTPHHARLMTIIANLAAVAIQNAMAYEEAQRAAVVNERARLARDLHDSIIQAVYAITWNMRTAHQVLPTNADRAGKLMEQALDTARTCLLDLRSLVFELRPELLEQYGLTGLLARHVESVQGRGPLDFNLEIGGEPELPLGSKEALYRIAQEALQNAVKHSGAQQVTLRLQQDLTQVFLEVKDDGVGFDPMIPSPGQLGLLSMRERAAKLGGKLEIVSGYGHGTQVQIQVPLPRARAAA